MIKLYTIGCPKCDILEEKLNAKNIEFIKCEDKDEMTSKNIDSLPVLEVDNTLLEYIDANNWINKK